MDVEFEDRCNEVFAFVARSEDDGLADASAGARVDVGVEAGVIEELAELELLRWTDGREEGGCASAGGSKIAVMVQELRFARSAMLRLVTWRSRRTGT